jgi:hypothetical protein
MNCFWGRKRKSTGGGGNVVWKSDDEDQKLGNFLVEVGG